jgi:hypothetical protein
MKEAEAIRKSIFNLASSQSDEKLVNNISAFPYWNPDGVKYLAGMLVQDKGKLYRVLQPHTSQKDWPPDKVPALFVIVGGDWEEWKPGSYAKGTKRKHFGKKWISNVDNNIWEPGATGVYTWDEWSESGV